MVRQVLQTFDLTKIDRKIRKLVVRGLVSALRRVVSLDKELYSTLFLSTQYPHTYHILLGMTELNNDERSVVRNAGDRARTRLGDLAGLAGYLKWPVFVGFSRTVNKPVG